MKFEEAKGIIEHRKRQQFLVSFERIEGSMLAGDHFPDIRGGEEPIADEAEAWEWARKFAEAMGPKKICNVYLIHGDFTPVAGYRDKMIFPR